MKRMSKYMGLLLATLLAAGCSQKAVEVPEWLKKTPHCSSPDGSAAIYFSQNDGLGFGEEAKTKSFYWANLIAVVNEHQKSEAEQVFELLSEHPTNIRIDWTTDTTVTINYDTKAEIVHQLETVTVSGRRLHLTYRIMDDNEQYSSLFTH